MFKRIAAIGFIVVCTSIAWAILGSTILYRTNYSDEQLKGRVSSAWGTAQEQTPPTAAYQIVSQKQVTSVENGTAAVRTVEQKTRSRCRSNKPARMLRCISITARRASFGTARIRWIFPESIASAIPAIRRNR